MYGEKKKEGKTKNNTKKNEWNLQNVKLNNCRRVSADLAAHNPLIVLSMFGMLSLILSCRRGQTVRRYLPNKLNFNCCHLNPLWFSGSTFTSFPKLHLKPDPSS